TYLELLRVGVIDGRLYADADGNAGRSVVVISRSAAERFWPGASPLGRRLRLGDPAGRWSTVVGVVSDVRQNWWNPPDAPTVYRPFLEAPGRNLTLAVRTRGDPLAILPAIRATVRALDPAIGLESVATLEDEVRDSIGLIRILSFLMLGFGLIGVALSV